MKIKDVKDSDLIDILQMVIKSADLGHGAKETELHTK